MKKVLSILAIILLLTLPLSSGEDFTLQIDIDVSKTTVEQGESFNVLVDAEGQYIADDPYSMDKQVLVEETVYLRDEKIGEGNIPIGAEGFIFYPQQTMSLNDAIPCRVPEDTPPGTYTLEVSFFAAAFGSSMKKTRYVQIEVVEAEEEEDIAVPPEIFLSMFPEEISYGSTTNLTIRVYNPNNGNMGATLQLKNVKEIGKYSIDNMEIELGPFETVELRRSFNLQQRLTELCFLAEIDHYTLDGKKYVPDDPIEEEICANVLQRPVFVPEINFGNFGQDGDYFTATAYLKLHNSSQWSNTMLPKQVSIIIEGPTAIEPSSKTFNYFALDHDISAHYAFNGPIDIGKGTDANMTIEIYYPERYGIESELISFNFKFPDSSRIGAELGIDVGEGEEDSGDDDPMAPALKAFLDSIGSKGELSEEEINGLLNGLIDWQREMFG